MVDTLHKNAKIKALVVDDSLLMGMQIAEILNEDDEVEVVGRASDGSEALKMVEELRPDVITMDIEMPNMDGLTALKHIMVKHPIPTVMISSFTKEATETSFDALRFGAIDVIAKPSSKVNVSLELQRERIVSRVKRAAGIRAERCKYRRLTKSTIHSRRGPGEAPDPSTRFVCVAAVTSGYYCLLGIVPALTHTFQDVLIATIPASRRHVATFVDYLDNHSVIPVKNLRTSKQFEKGTCFVCSVNDRLLLSANDSGGLEFEFQEPDYHSEEESAIDRLLTSLAHEVGPRSVGLVMGAGGNEGHAGIEAILRCGGLGLLKNITGCRRQGMIQELLYRDAQRKASPEPIRYERIETGYARDNRSDHRHVRPSNDSFEFCSDNDTFTGFVRGIDIIDYLQFVLLTGRPTVLEVLSNQGETGRIYVRDGNVLHAYCGDLLGDRALFKCLAFRGGRFSNRPWREPASVSIDKPGELVLMEAARQRDEAQCEWITLAN